MIFNSHIFRKVRDSWRSFCHVLLSVTVMSSMQSCRMTKYVPDDELLLDRIHISGDLGSSSSSELSDYVRQQPNARTFHLWRMSLGLYSLSGERPTGFNNWLRNIGSAPVLYNEDLTSRSSEQLRLFMISKGYYDCTVSDTMIVTKSKRCEVYYNVNAGRVYKIESLGFSAPDDAAGHLILNDTIHTLLHAGDPFDSNVHDEERERIARFMQNHGYYDFGKDYIYFVADSNGLDHAVRDSLIVSNAMGGADKRTEMPHRQAVIDDVTIVVMAPDSVGRLVNPSDSTRFERHELAPGLSESYSGERRFRDDVLKNSCFVEPGALYSLSDVELSQSRITSLKAFRQASFRFLRDTTASDTLTHLSCVAVLSTNKTQTFGVDLDGTNSSGNLGAAVSMNYSHANIFHGAEYFTLKGRLAIEHQSATSGTRNFNTLEMGVDASVTLPFMLAPIHSAAFHKRRNPHTLFSTSFDFQRRPEFTRTVITTKMSYTWRGSRYVQHSLTPLEFNIVNIPSISDEFESYISDTYLQYSYTDHFIMSLGYTFLYNQQRVRRNQSGVYFRFSMETAGNVLNLLTRNQETEDDFKKIWNIRFSQYFRTEAEFRYLAIDRWGNNLVGRVFAGIGIPYGNSIMLPYEKSFFVGGANSIRAWPVRGLGPGSSVTDASLHYHNQTGDIRLEANIEYRAKLFSIFEGAIFADAGNIWTLNHSYNDADGVITKDFYKQIALGSGLGVRLNFDYFIFRVDVAYRLHDPSQSSPWVIKNKYDSDNLAWNFAIGYPF